MSEKLTWAEIQEIKQAAITVGAPGCHRVVRWEKTSYIVGNTVRLVALIEEMAETLNSVGCDMCGGGGYVYDKFGDPIVTCVRCKGSGVSEGAKAILPEGYCE